MMKKSILFPFFPFCLLLICCKLDPIDNEKTNNNALEEFLKTKLEITGELNGTLSDSDKKKIQDIKKIFLLIKEILTRSERSTKNKESFLSNLVDFCKNPGEDSYKKLEILQKLGNTIDFFEVLYGKIYPELVYKDQFVGHNDDTIKVDGNHFLQIDINTFKKNLETVLESINSSEQKVSLDRQKKRSKQEIEKIEQKKKLLELVQGQLNNEKTDSDKEVTVADLINIELENSKKLLLQPADFFVVKIKGDIGNVKIRPSDEENEKFNRLAAGDALIKLHCVFNNDEFFSNKVKDSTKNIQPPFIAIYRIVKTKDE